MSELGAGGKSLAHMHAERLAETRYIEMLASAGVSVNRVSHEVLYFIPTQFRDAYIHLFTSAMKGDDADASQQGKRNEATGALGREAGKNTATGTVGTGADKESRRTDLASGQTRAVGGRGKKYKRYWTITDERAFHLKERIDRRLRAIARDIEEELQFFEKGGKREYTQGGDQGREAEGKGIEPSSKGESNGIDEN